MSQSSNKRLVEQARQERAARKRQRRLDRAAEQPEPAEPAESVVDQSSTLDALTRLHETYDAGSIDFDEFESAKRELIAQLRVD